MRVINKKMVVVVLLIIEFTCGYLMYQSSKKEVDLAKVTYEEEIKDSMFAMYVENEDTGEYDEVTNTNTFPEGYILNMDKTGCIDNKGNSISDILTSKDDKVMVKSNKTVFCYLYFDKDNRVYTQVKSDYKNNTGALLLSETESDEYPVYYYSGNITNNNILYANFCWKMVRTTETGGVKLIYNGVPDEAEDGTKTCDNTGEETMLKGKFNSNINSLAYAGYMYNNVYKTIEHGFTNGIHVLARYWQPPAFYYGDTATWNETTQRYELSNSDGSEVTTYVWDDYYSDLVGKYTCLSTTDAICWKVYYVVGGSAGSHLFYYELTDGKAYDDYKIKLATSIKDNGDGTYTLVNPIEVSKADWYTTYSDYKNYYYCNDLTSETCNDMYYSTSSGNYYLDGINRADVYKYGNSFVYEDGVYKLVDTKEFWYWPDNYNTLNNNHYTCFNTTGECENIYYIFQTTSGRAYYTTLNNGKSVDDAINEMLYAENVNQTNSTVKDIIDTWYSTSGVTEYTHYLENTIWCNNREISNLAGWNPNGGSMTSYLSFKGPDINCSNKTDQFTLNVEAGGTEGYGNNALDYPIGLLTAKEVALSSAEHSSYLKQGTTFWLMTPYGYLYYRMNWRILSLSSVDNSLASDYAVSNGVRPSVSLSNKVEITDGDGSVTAPYQVILPN